jgi:hypothetical protein
LEQIVADDNLLRRIPIDPNYIKPDNSMSSLAFKPRSVDANSLSVDLERLTTHEKAILDRARFRLCRLQASVPLNLGFACVHNPTIDNPAHTLIQGAFTKQVCRTLAGHASFIL